MSEVSFSAFQYLVYQLSFIFIFYSLFGCCLFSDPFVDDSEEVAAVTLELKKRKLKTVHDGFFVSSGELEVQKDETFRERKSMVVQNVKERIKGIEKDKSIIIPSFLLDDILLQKLVIKKKKKDIDNKIESNSPLPSTINNLLVIKKKKKDIDNKIESTSPNPSTINDLLDSAIIVPRVRTVKPKPFWVPTLQTLDALEAFKNVFLTMEIKINKSGLIPLQVHRKFSYFFCL